jgi:hypothetical protein
MRNVELDKAVTHVTVMTNDTKFCSAKEKNCLRERGIDGIIILK